MSLDPAPGTRRAEDVSGTVTGNASPLTAALPEWKGNERYAVVSRIGEGAMGVVYEAFDRERQEIVALKTMLRFSPGALVRFKQEFRTLSDVHHPNLVRLHELVASEGANIFFTMELVNGSDFATYVQRPDAATRAPSLRLLGVEQTLANQPTPSASSVRPASLRPLPKVSPADMERLRYALRQLVEGVHALHRAGKVHRDIKPSNVLVTPAGRVVILDFGVAADISGRVNEQLTEADEIVGTVRYMAPEQALAEALTPAADWYSVGVMLYEALVGSAPFVGPTTAVLAMKTSRDPVPPSQCVKDVPPDLDDLCQALLRREAGERPTAPEILSRLGGTRSFRPASPLPPSVPGRAKELVGRERQLAALRDAFEQVRAGRPLTLLLAGASGMGKSAVAEHFLDELVDRGEALVLRGRAYEREAIPYKAVDGAIDALSRYLLHVEEQGKPVDLPADMGALARVFPVLRRAASLDENERGVVPDPNFVRRQAFAALRSLLGAVAARQPLVVYVDDAQWGDADSAALLLELVRPPHAPPLLYVMTHREEEAKTSSFVLAVRDRWPEGADVRPIKIGPLDEAEAQRLALALLDSADEGAQRLARAAARESQGSPFLVEELVRHNVNLLAGHCEALSQRNEMASLEAMTLGQMVGQRLDRLPEGARQLVEVLAVAGRPLPVSVVAAASGAGASVDDAIAAARARRFVRTGLRSGFEVVETSHDAFRETVAAQLSPEQLRAYHERLARALEAAPQADAEAIARHLIGAGDSARAARFVERAAEEAIAKLAFEHAARLLRMAVENSPGSPEEKRRLRTRLATVLEWAGRAEDAARAYLEAAEGAEPLHRAQLERAASTELLASGRMAEGAAVLRRVLAAVGLSAPNSVLSAVFWLILHRMRLALLARSADFGFVPRPPESIAPLARAQVDAVYVAAYGFKYTDVIVGTCMTTRSVLLALRFGDRLQALRAVVIEAGQHAAPGGPPGKIERKLADFADRLGREIGTPIARGLLEVALGVRLYLRGEWKKALETLDGVDTQRVHDHQKGGWQADRNIFSCWSLSFLGEHRELAKRYAAILEDADQRGDRYTSVQLRDGSLAIVRLAADDPEGARHQVAEAMEMWPNDRYLLQHWHRLYGETEIELYVGDGAKAYARVELDRKALKKSLLLKIQNMRVRTAFLRGRCALASLDAEPAWREARLAEARRLATELEGEGAVWSAPFAAILKAGVANAEGDRPGAIAGLKAAIDLALAADMKSYATAARHQLGLLIGGVQGAEYVVAAEGDMKAQGVRAPARFAATLVPGRWRAE